MFKIGSRVVYRSEGVCVVSDIRSESFGMIGRAEDYYILTPISDNKSTVFVPVNNEKLVAYMRALMSAEEITEMISELREQRMDWIEESRARNAAFKEVLALGDRRQLIIMLNTLAEKKEEIKAAGKKIPTGDLNALRRAEKLLYDEFSATTDIAGAKDIIRLLRGELTLNDK